MCEETNRHVHQNITSCAMQNIGHVRKQDAVLAQKQQFVPVQSNNIIILVQNKTLVFLHKQDIILSSTTRHCSFCINATLFLFEKSLWLCPKTNIVLVQNQDTAFCQNRTLYLVQHQNVVSCGFCQYLGNLGLLRAGGTCWPATGNLPGRPLSTAL